MTSATETVCDICSHSLIGSTPPLWRCPACNAVPRQRHFLWLFKSGKLRPDHEPGDALCVAEDRQNRERLVAHYKITSVALYGRERRAHLNGVDVRDLSAFADDAFDLVTAIGVFDYVDDAASAFISVARVLRPGGLFLLHIMPHLLRNTNAAPTLKGTNPSSDTWFAYLPPGVPISTYYYGMEWIVKALGDVGLSTEVMERREAGSAHHWFLARRPL